MYLDCCLLYSDSESYSLVTELVKGDTLRARLEKQGHLSESEARVVLRTLLETLDCVHSRGIAHRDMKPDNCMIAEPQKDKGELGNTNMDIVLIDFGFAAEFSGRSLSDMCGSPAYGNPTCMCCISSPHPSPLILFTNSPPRDDIRTLL